jgi:hypothetical protein
MRPAIAALKDTLGCHDAGTVRRSIVLKGCSEKVDSRTTILVTGILSATDWLDLEVSASIEEPSLITSSRTTAAYTDVVVQREDVCRLWTSRPENALEIGSDQLEQALDSKPKKLRTKRGPKPNPHWRDIEEHMRELINRYGGMLAEKKTPGWSRSRIVNETLMWCSSERNIEEPVSSEMYEHLASLIKTIR